MALPLHVTPEHVQGHLAGRGEEVARAPEVAAPQVPLELRKLFPQEPRGNALQAVHELRHLELRLPREQYVDVIQGGLLLDDFHAEAFCDAAHDLLEPFRHRTFQHLAAVLHAEN